MSGMSDQQVRTVFLADETEPERFTLHPLSWRRRLRHRFMRWISRGLGELVSERARKKQF